MGRDKAGVEVAGASLLARTRAALAVALGPQAPVVTVGSPGGPRPGTWIPDLRPRAGPLAGLEAALAWGREHHLTGVLLVGVDHPWLEPAVLRLLVDRLPADRLLADDGVSAGTVLGTVLGTADGPLLLLGAYRTEALPVVSGLLDRGERRLQALGDHLDLDVVAPGDWHHLDPSGATAVDVDAPADLQAAHRHLGDRDPRHRDARGPRHRSDR
jgi:molybdopterin-guanine dinucleotide biosynthesis protein A